MSRPSQNRSVPCRWLDYSSVGKRLDGTRFLAFKVPLKQSLNRQLPPADVFGPWELLDSVQQDQQELGLIIDLTNTRRYYSLQDVPESLLVLKILTAGHEVPSDDIILSFKRAVRWFLRENAENDQLVGVHCTHGLNRTGYLVCRYLIDVDGMDPQAALQLFNSSRGHNVERQNYLDDLCRGPKRSNEGMEDVEQQPMRGLASQRPMSTPPDTDSTEDRRVRDTRNHRPFPSRETNQRWHSHHPHDGPPSLPPVNTYRWTPLNTDGQWRRPPRSEVQEDSRSRYAPQEDSRSRYSPQENRGSRYSPQENRGSRYSPQENRGSRYAPQENRGSRYAPQENRGSRYSPQENRGSRYAPPENRGSRYAPPENRGSRYAPLEDRRRGDPPLPRYSARWTKESIS